MARVEHRARPQGRHVRTALARRESGEGKRRPLASRPAAESSSAEEPRTGRRILVVDDDSSIRLVCTVNLRLAGYGVVEAADGTEALRRAEEDDFDLVLLDVMLPDLGGHEVARRLGARAPIAFLSARASDDDLRAGYEAGAVDYITKPFDPLELAERVEEILTRAARGESESFRRARLAELE
jgi:DNA-binding response OmpR family regulator